jgi:hypothetical protein
MINVTNVDRSAPARTNPFTRGRTRVITAGVALAVAAGLAGPAIAAFAATPTAASASATVATADAKTAKTTKAAKSTKTKSAVPTKKQLHPAPVAGHQERFKPSNEQLRNARAIVKASKKMNLPPRATVIAMATAMQESTLRNIGHLGANNDHDSQGLFQQRPSAGWGTPKQITNPRYAATAFYKKLIAVDGWKRMNLTDAAQAVQVSAFPNHYAKWEKHAGNIVSAFYGAGPYAKQAATLK